MKKRKAISATKTAAISALALGRVGLLKPGEGFSSKYKDGKLVKFSKRLANGSEVVLFSV